MRFTLLAHVLNTNIPCLNFESLIVYGRLCTTFDDSGYVIMIIFILKTNLLRYILYIVKIQRRSVVV